MKNHPELRTFDLIDNFVIIKHICDGGFGSVYLVRDTSQNNQPFAMKIAHKDQTFLLIEADVLKEIQDSMYVPKLNKVGLSGSYRYIVMKLLGPSLGKIRKVLDKKRFSLYTILSVSLQTLTIIQNFHNRGFVHRDIKPSNFLIKIEMPQDIILIDFGFSKRHIDPLTDMPHLPDTNGSFVGTLKYASLNAHYHNDLGRCDDLISWFYSISELASGQLPWDSKSGKEDVKRTKETVSVEELCKNLPVEFQQIYLYISTLKYDDEPDYSYIATQIGHAMRNHDFEKKRTLDWETLENKVISSISAIPFSPEKRFNNLRGIESEHQLAQQAGGSAVDIRRSVSHHLLDDEPAEVRSCGRFLSCFPRCLSKLFDICYMFGYKSGMFRI